MYHTYNRLLGSLVISNTAGVNIISNLTFLQEVEVNNDAKATLASFALIYTTSV